MVELEGVVRTVRGAPPQLAGVDLKLAAGERAVVLERFGGGASTLLQLILGMVRCAEGRVTVFGLDPVAEPVAVRRRIGYMPPLPLLPGSLRIGHVLDLHAGLFPRWDRGREAALLDRFRLARGARLGSLSHLEGRRVGLLCALAHHPELLLLDGPAGGLAGRERADWMEEVHVLVGEEACAAIVATAHAEDVQGARGRLLILDGGRWLADLPLEDVARRYRIVQLRTRAIEDLAARPGFVRGRVVGRWARGLFDGNAGSLGGGDVRVPTVEELLTELCEGRA